MTHQDRFIAMLVRRPVEGPASWWGLPATAALPQLLMSGAPVAVRALFEAVHGEVAR